MNNLKIYYQKKYFKYKNKYIYIKNQLGGTSDEVPNEVFSRELGVEHDDKPYDCNSLTHNLLFEIYQISKLLLDNIPKTDIILCIGQSPAYFAIGMIELNSLTKGDHNIHMIPLSGISGLSEEIERVHVDEISEYILSLSKILTKTMFDSDPNITIIDFSIRGDTINFFVNVLLYKLLDTYSKTPKYKSLNKVKFINIMATSQFNGTIGPEVKNLDGVVVMKNEQRVKFTDIIKLSDIVNCVGYIISENMEFFTMNGVERIIPEFRYHQWSKSEDNKLPLICDTKEAKNCIRKTNKWIKIFYDYDKNKTPHPELTEGVIAIINENEDNIRYIEESTRNEKTGTASSTPYTQRVSYTPSATAAGYSYDADGFYKHEDFDE